MPATALIVLQIAWIGTVDSARISGDRLIVEPLGFSIEIPALWLRKPTPPELRYCDTNPARAVSERFLTDRAALERLRLPHVHWREAYAAVVDSTMRFAALKAHLGSVPWDGNCSHLQVRVYVEDTGAATVASRAERGVESAQRVFPAERGFRPAKRFTADSAGWQITRITWVALYGDNGGTEQAEFWTRRVRDRLVTLVFMYAPYRDDERAVLASILKSARDGLID
jgi:hypothetical protein